MAWQQMAPWQQEAETPHSPGAQEAGKGRMALIRFSPFPSSTNPGPTGLRGELAMSRTDLPPS